MKIGFYPRLAVDGIRKNRRLYLPYLFTCVLMVGMFYIMEYLSMDPTLPTLAGGRTLMAIMMLGSYVIGIFAVIFLFYTNSFLIRRRKKEFGLYNILGMGKGSLGRIMLWETVILCLVSLAVGLVFGIALSKLAELGLTNIVGGTVSLDFFVPLTAVRDTVVLFALIFGLIFLNVLRQVGFSSPMELLRSENVGEKPPKANWLLGAAGVVILGVAYYMAVSIQQPLRALSLFFVAVILVIVATYLLMIAGSVLFCRVLQKNKGYYYKSNHFVSLSSMVYRMKRNGAGLASICILVTMVLVMISSSACLYFGAEDSLRTRYPRDIAVELDFKELTPENKEVSDRVRACIEEALAATAVQAKDVVDYQKVYTFGMMFDGVFQAAPDNYKLDMGPDYDKLITVHFMDLADYNRMYGQQETLSDGEAMVFADRIKHLPDTLTFGEQQLRVVKQVKHVEMEADVMTDVVPALVLIVPDVKAATLSLADMTAPNGTSMLGVAWYYRFDTDLSMDGNIQLGRVVADVMSKEMSDHMENGVESYSWSCLDAERGDFFATYGGLFFLGIMLSIVFLMAAVLIIYYKQISEGYEDQSRFEIMQKVGMTKGDIRRSINSQLLTVFFLPFVFAVLHLGFAFPMIRKVLILFSVTNVRTLLLTTAISVLVFGVFYTIVYRMTSNVYYSIVSGAKE